MINFGTGGFRGIIADNFTRESVEIIAQALCNVAKEDKTDEKPIVIGYDNRFMSDFFAKWMAEVFAANGIKVIMYSIPVPTPVVMFSVMDMGLFYGIMITASHNPYYYNGVKLFLKQGVDADVNFTNRLSEASGNVSKVNAEDFNSALKNRSISLIDNIDRYLNNISHFISPAIKGSDIHIVYDNLNGVGYVGLKRLASIYGLRNLDIFNTKHDAFFSFEMPNPREDTLKHLKTRVVKKGYSFGIATDSDADRLGVIDERGRYINNHIILGCLYYYLVRYRNEKGDIVKNFSTSYLIDMLAQKLGYRCHETDVGFKFISAEMKRTNALIGGEASGGLTVRGYINGKDSVFSSMLFIEMCVVMNKPVSEIIREVCDFAGYDSFIIEKELVLKSEDKWLSLFDRIPGFIGEAKRRMVGSNVKFVLENGDWILFRKSGTESVLRIVAEMKNADKARHFVENAVEFLMD